MGRGYYCFYHIFKKISLKYLLSPTCDAILVIPGKTASSIGSKTSKDCVKHYPYTNWISAQEPANKGNGHTVIAFWPNRLIAVSSNLIVAKLIGFVPLYIILVLHFTQLYLLETSGTYSNSKINYTQFATKQ